MEARIFQNDAKYESRWDKHLKTITVAKRRTVSNVPNALPIHSALYLTGPKHQELELKEVAQREEAGVAEPTVTDYASPIVLIPKIDGSLHFCRDYRLLNAVTVRDSYLTPRMDE